MYNKSPYIERMVESLSKQTYLPRTKIIVVDDCSTDDSVEVLKRAADRFEIEIDLRSNRQNLGVSGTSRNIYWMIETPFWAMLDPDDYYIDPRRLERAVEFLESNPDHSMHGCNFFREFEDGRRIPAIPEGIENFSASDLTTMPFFQTSAATFRNFWTEDLLLELERIAGDSRYHATEADSFRNFCAIHSGKVYFENLLCSVYSMGVGIYDPISSIEKDVMEMYLNYFLFEFARDFFHNETNAMFSIRLAYTLYLRASNQISEMLRSYSATEFQASNYFKTMMNLRRGDFVDVCEVMLEYCKKFKDLGVGIRK